MKRCLFFAVMLSLTLIVHADVIWLANGDKITGQIISMTEKTVKIKTEYGTIDIDRSRIVKGEFGDEETESDAALEDPSSSVSASSSGNIPAPLINFLFNSVVVNTGSQSVQIKINTVNTFDTDQLERKNESIYTTGDGEYFITTAPDALLNADQLTFRARFKIYNPVKTQYIVSMWESTSGDKAVGKFAVCYTYGNCVVYLADEAGNYYTIAAASAITPLAWTDLVLSVGKDKIYLYLNGKLVKEVNTPFSALQKSAIPIHFLTATGGPADTGLMTYNFNGNVSEISVWEVALTKDQILSLE